MALLLSYHVREKFLDGDPVADEIDIEHFLQTVKRNIEHSIGIPDASIVDEDRRRSHIRANGFGCCMDVLLQGDVTLVIANRRTLVCQTSEPKRGTLDAIRTSRE